MANINEQKLGADYCKVYQIDPEDLVIGGEGGIANLQAENLAQRDNFLKKEIEANVEKISAVEGKADVNTAEIEKLKAQAVPLGAIVAFPKAITNPVGFLKCDGSEFNQATYPDLYRILGNNNTLPNLQRSNIGQLAYFSFDEVPAGWLEFDKLQETLEADSENKYTELKGKIYAQFGGLDNIPKSENRFIRGLGESLQIGQVQGDAIRNITGTLVGQRYYGYDSEGGAFFNGGTLGYVQYNQVAYDGMKFDASRVVPTAEENRPVAIAFKLCIKALDTAEDVNCWIKSASGVVNGGMLDASTLSQDIQEQRTALSNKADKSELTSIRNDLAHQNKPLKQKVIWEGEVLKSTLDNAIVADFKAGDVLFFELWYDQTPPTPDNTATWHVKYNSLAVEVINSVVGYQIEKKPSYWGGWGMLVVSIHSAEKKIAILDNSTNCKVRRISKLVR